MTADNSGICSNGCSFPDKSTDILVVVRERVRIGAGFLTGFTTPEAPRDVVEDHHVGEVERHHE